MSATEKTNPPGSIGSGAGPSTSTQESPSQHRRSRLLTWATFILLFLVVLVISSALIIYGVVRPKGIIYSVQQAYIHEYNFTCCNFLSAVYNITIRSENSNNKVRIQYYDAKMHIRCTNNKQQLAISNISSWEQLPRNVTLLNEKLNSQKVKLHKCQKGDLADHSKGNMTINVSLTAKIRFKPENWALDGRTIRVSCSQVAAVFSDGIRTFQPKICDVEL